VNTAPKKVRRNKDDVRRYRCAAFRGRIAAQLCFEVAVCVFAQSEAEFELGERAESRTCQLKILAWRFVGSGPPLFGASVIFCVDFL
jgi:hypothetical protein